MQFFEITQDQRQLADTGRAMMDFVDDYGQQYGLKGVTEQGLRTLNQLGAVGRELTTIGTPFGARVKDFDDETLELISNFMQKKVDIHRR